MYLVLQLLLFTFIGVINVQSCSISAIDQCTCTGTDSSNCDGLSLDLGIKTLSFECSSTTDAAGYCTVPCSKVSVKVAGIKKSVSGSNICSTYLNSATGLGFECDGATSPKCIFTAPTFAWIACADFDITDPISSVLACDCSNDSTACDALNGPLSGPLSVGSESIVCDPATGFCTLTCDNGTDACAAITDVVLDTRAKCITDTSPNYCEISVVSPVDCSTQELFEANCQC
eukprot:37025_1